MVQSSMLVGAGAFCPWMMKYMFTKLSKSKGRPPPLKRTVTQPTSFLSGSPTLAYSV